jgi:DNA-binding IclR family transcriptional regulator
VLKLAGRLLDTNRVRLESMSHLDYMARKSGERANLGILHGGEMLYLAGAEKPSLPMIYTRFGQTSPAHCSAVGKAMLAYLPERELQGFPGKGLLMARTENTLTDPEARAQSFPPSARAGSWWIARSWRPGRSVSRRRSSWAG